MKNSISNNNSVDYFIKDLKLIVEEHKPLTKSEEKALIEKYKNNREKLNELLILHNIRLVFTLSNKYKNSCFDYDEMIQAGLHGLTIASTKFNITGSTKFSSYAAFWIRKYILAQFYNKHNAHINNGALSLDVGDIHEEYSNSDIITYKINDPDYISASPFSNIEESDIFLMFKKVKNIIDTSNMFDAIDKKIFNDYFIKNNTLSQISKKIKRSIPLVQYRKTKILNLLKKEIETRYNISAYNEI